MAEVLKTVIWLCTKLGKGLTERLLFRLFFGGGVWILECLANLQVLLFLLDCRTVENGRETVEEFENGVLTRRLVDGNIQAIRN